MTPPRQATPDQTLLALWATLQARAGNARSRHEDLAGRARVLRAAGAKASAEVLETKARAALADYERIQRELLDFLGRNPSLTKTDNKETT